MGRGCSHSDGLMRRPRLIGPNWRPPRPPRTARCVSAQTEPDQRPSRPVPQADRTARLSGSESERRRALSNGPPAGPLRPVGPGPNAECHQGAGPITAVCPKLAALDSPATASPCQSTSKSRVLRKLSPLTSIKLGPVPPPPAHVGANRMRCRKQIPFQTEEFLRFEHRQGVGPWAFQSNWIAEPAPCRW